MNTTVELETEMHVFSSENIYAKDILKKTRAKNKNKLPQGTEYSLNQILHHQPYFLTY